MEKQFSQERKSRVVRIGDTYIGGDHTVKIQSMTNTLTTNIQSTIEQINSLERVGCEIIRVAIPDEQSAKAIPEIKKAINIPLVADIHFDYKLAILSAKMGADKLRINPGNIGADWKIKEVVQAAKDSSIPIRIGVNSGSLEKKLVKKSNIITPKLFLESVQREIDILEGEDFQDIVVALKSSDIATTIETNILFASQYDYPLHIGITEAGTYLSGTVKSSLGLGILLLRDIGETIRVSLSADPIYEVLVAKEILKYTGKRNDLPEIISCPTCARAEIDVIKIANELEKNLSSVKGGIRIAVMGCVVNGPGEAKEADIGIAGSRDGGLIFSRGKPLYFVKNSAILKTLLDEITKYLNEKERR